MAGLRAEIFAHNIVLIGDFNTLIFQPAWFAAQELIRQSEAEAANVEVIHRDVVAFSLDWLKIQVTRDRFMVQTRQEPYYQTVRDLVIGTFRILEHTPLRFMGINFEFHFRLANDDGRWQRFQEALMTSSKFRSIFDNGSIAGIIFRDERKFNQFPGQLTVRMEPSPQIPGVHVNVNDHYDADRRDEKIQNASEVTDILAGEWESSYSRSEKYAKDIMGAL